jgi:hypothetical protein
MNVHEVLDIEFKTFLQNASTNPWRDYDTAQAYNLLNETELLHAAIVDTAVTDHRDAADNSYYAELQKRAHILNSLREAVDSGDRTVIERLSQYNSGVAGTDDRSRALKYSELGFWTRQAWEAQTVGLKN